MTHDADSTSFRARAPAFCAVLVLALLWELLVRVLGVPEYIFPTLTRVCYELLVSGGTVLYHLLITLGVACLGLLVGTSMSLGTALIFARFGLIRRALLPILIAGQAIPVVALAPYFLIWFGPGLTSRVLLICILVFLPGLLVTVEGLRRSRRDAGLLFDVIRVTPSRRFRWLTVPLAMPAIASAIDLTAALSVIGAIVSELSGQPNGVGFLVIIASYQFDTPAVFAVLSAAAIGSFVLFSLVRLGTLTLRRKFAIYYEGG